MIDNNNTPTDPAAFFLSPGSPRQRQYEALRAYFVEGKSSEDAARAFGYSPGAFRVLCSRFRNNPRAREFFLLTSVGRHPGVRHHDPVREEVIALRKKNYSVYDTSSAFAESGKVDFDLALLVVASGLYRRFANRMRGYADARARQVFRGLLDLPATVKVTPSRICVTFHRRAHLPILPASDLFTETPSVPWWNGARLVLHAAHVSRFILRGNPG